MLITLQLRYRSMANVLGLLWDLVTLPIKLVLLPFKILSFIVSMVVYSIVLLVLAGIVFLFLL